MSYLKSQLPHPGLEFFATGNFVKLFVGFNFFVQTAIILCGNILVIGQVIEIPMPRISYLYFSDFIYLILLFSLFEKLRFLSFLRSKTSILLLMAVNFVQLPPFYFNFFRSLSPFRNLYVLYWPGGLKSIQQYFQMADHTIPFYGLMAVPYLILFWNLTALTHRLYNTNRVI